MGTVITATRERLQISTTRRRTWYGTEGIAMIACPRFQALREARQVIERAEHANAVQQAAAFLVVVIEEPHHAPFMAAREFLHEAHGRVAPRP